MSVTWVLLGWINIVLSLEMTSKCKYVLVTTAKEGHTKTAPLKRPFVPPFYFKSRKALLLIATLLRVQVAILVPLFARCPVKWMVDFSHFRWTDVFVDFSSHFQCISVFGIWLQPDNVWPLHLKGKFFKGLVLVSGHYGLMSCMMHFIDRARVWLDKAGTCPPGSTYMGRELHRSTEAANGW